MSCYETKGLGWKGGEATIESPCFTTEIKKLDGSKPIDTLCIRKVGGSRGNSPVGQNFGRLWAPESSKLQFNCGEIQTRVFMRYGSLLTYYQEAFVASLTPEEIGILVLQGWRAIPITDVIEKGNDYFQPNGKEWWTAY